MGGSLRILEVSNDSDYQEMEGLVVFDLRERELLYTQQYILIYCRFIKPTRFILIMRQILSSVRPFENGFEDKYR